MLDSDGLTAVTKDDAIGKATLSFASFENEVRPHDRYMTVA